MAVKLKRPFMLELNRASHVLRTALPAMTLLLVHSVTGRLSSIRVSCASRSSAQKVNTLTSRRTSGRVGFALITSLFKTNPVQRARPFVHLVLGLALALLVA